MISQKINLKKLMMASLAVSAFAGCAFSANSFAEDITNSIYVRRGTDSENIWVATGTKTSGNVTYTAATNTVTINNENETVETIITSNGDRRILNVSGNNNIALRGKWTIQGSGNINCSLTNPSIPTQQLTCLQTDGLIIDLDGKIVVDGIINGDGFEIKKGNVILTKPVLPAAGIINSGPFVMNGGSIKTFGDAVGQISIVGIIQQESDLTINAGTLNAVGAAYGIQILDGNFVMNGGSATIKSMGQIEEGEAYGAALVLGRTSGTAETVVQNIKLSPSTKVKEENIYVGDATREDEETGEDTVMRTLTVGIPEEDPDTIFTNIAREVNFGASYQNTIHYVGEEEEKEEESEENTPDTPDTGLFSKDGNFVKLLPVGILAGIAIFIAVLKLSASREVTKRRVRKF